MQTKWTKSFKSFRMYIPTDWITIFCPFMQWLWQLPWSMLVFLFEYATVWLSSSSHWSTEYYIKYLYFTLFFQFFYCVCTFQTKINISKSHKQNCCQRNQHILETAMYLHSASCFDAATEQTILTSRIVWLQSDKSTENVIAFMQKYMSFMSVRILLPNVNIFCYQVRVFMVQNVKLQVWLCSDFLALSRVRQEFITSSLENFSETGQQNSTCLILTSPKAFRMSGNF